MATVTWPTAVHVTPSFDAAALNVLPARVRRSHSGGVPLRRAFSVVTPPVALRDCTTTPPAAYTAAITCLELGVSDSRNITPALAPVLVFSRLRRRTVMVPS